MRKQTLSIKIALENLFESFKKKIRKKRNPCDC